MEKVLVNKYWNVKIFIECSHNKALKYLLPPRNGLKLRNHLNKDSIWKVQVKFDCTARKISKFCALINECKQEYKFTGNTISSSTSTLMNSYTAVLAQNCL